MPVRRPAGPRGRDGRNEGRMRAMRRIAIVGGGASGVLLAVHLLRHRPDGLIVTMIERRPDLGAGVAYATKHPDHLLNVRASNMSAFPDDPGHFSRWLDGQGRAGGPDGFEPRRLYRDYLAGLTDPLFLEGQLRRVRGEAAALRDDALGFDILCRDGEGGPETSVRADVVVVATGNEGPTLPAEPWRHAGWGGDQDRPPIAHDAPVLVIGTGLTMVDRVLWLLHDGHRGPITAVSRHGLMPQAHRPTPPTAPFAAEDLPLGRPIRALTRWLRDRAANCERSGSGWRAAVDGLRPHTQALWRQLPEDERRRFLRHVRPFWDMHRHRIAPQAAAQLAAAERRGQLTIVAGRMAHFEPHAGGVAVTVLPRGSGTAAVYDAAAVFECRGRPPTCHGQKIRSSGTCWARDGRGRMRSGWVSTLRQAARSSMRAAKRRTVSTPRARSPRALLGNRRHPRHPPAGRSSGEGRVDRPGSTGPAGEARRLTA